MTVDAVRRTRRRAPQLTAAAEPIQVPAAAIAIGELEQTIFDCPSCSRPLALGARRCAGCRTRLINGVTLGKASGFIAAGLALGLMAGVTGSLLLGLANGATRLPASAAAGPTAAIANGANGSASSAPVSTPSADPTPTASTGSASTGIPALTRSALVQVVGTNGRLATAATDLRAALAARQFDASAVAQTLRSVSADSVFGQQLAAGVSSWQVSSAVGADLARFYGAIRSTAAEGLVASVQNEAAYRAAATSMVTLLDGMPALDAVVRNVAGSAGVVLPGA
jgi:hypothetical protein